MSRLIVASCAALLLGITGCCHTPSTQGPASAPPTFGFFALVHPHREILCVDMPPGQCAVVTHAVDEIDTAVGFELLSHPKATKGTDHLDGAEVTLVFNDDEPNKDYWGVTKPRSAIQPCWLGVVTVNFNPLMWSDADLYTAVVLHELVHSVGAGHAEADGFFASDERPSWTQGSPTSLTPGDKAALRAAYPHS